ncbi:ion transporter [Epilithonimonas vandammei]|uniref:Ion transporter n=1 Tax=Epilithonimonas vandammei TaxID=2487072 RepID=A0A3G8Y4I6_9FLAO|nr:ion transporter [Epilithonimonas vandammei]AZI40258.1 ion transporter [Epilithonimonas vandammei]
MKIKPEFDLIPEDGWRKKIYEIIYLSDTKAGRTFDIGLLILIVFSTVLIMVETIPIVTLQYYKEFYYAEFFITIIFTIEYLLRIICIKDRKEYIFSPIGIIDFLSIIPFYISLIFPVWHFVAIIRMLRILRIFRIFNLADYMHDGHFIVSALKHSSRKIYIFLLFMIIFIVIIGAMMYVVEDGKNGFSSIPQSVYWAVVTITTVGYGDISPATPLGKLLSIIVMLCGYSIIAVPTGIVTSEFRRRRSDLKCDRCGNDDHGDSARYCKICGEKMV